MSDLTRLTIAEARDGLAAGKFTAEELAKAALFLASDESRNITGVLLPVRSNGRSPPAAAL